MPDRYSLKIQQMQRLEAKQQPLQTMGDRSTLSGQRQVVAADGGIQYGQKLSNAAQDGEPVSLLPTPTGAAIDGRNVPSEEDGAIAPPWGSGLVRNAIDTGIMRSPGLGNAEGYLRGQLWARPEEGEIRWEFDVGVSGYVYNGIKPRWQGFRLEPTAQEDSVTSTGIAVGLISAPNGAIVSGRVEAIVLSSALGFNPSYGNQGQETLPFLYGSLATIGYLPDRLLGGEFIQGVKFFDANSSYAISDFLTTAFWVAPDRYLYLDNLLTKYKRLYRHEEADPFVGQPISISFSEFSSTFVLIYRQLQPRSFSGFLPPGDHTILVLANLAPTGSRGGTQHVPLYLATPDYWDFQININLL